MSIGLVQAMLPRYGATPGRVRQPMPWLEACKQGCTSRMSSLRLRAWQLPCALSSGSHVTCRSGATRAAIARGQKPEVCRGGRPRVLPDSASQCSEFVETWCHRRFSMRRSRICWSLADARFWPKAELSEAESGQPFGQPPPPLGLGCHFARPPPLTSCRNEPNRNACGCG